MSSLLEGDGQKIEQELISEPVVGPATGSIVLHGLIFGGLILYGFIGGFFHHNDWGSPEAGGGAIQVNMVSGVLPLPNDQPHNQNVLATETPSQAPAPPEPKAKQTVDDTAIPIAAKNAKQQATKDNKTAAKTQPHQQQAKQSNLAQFGEQSGSNMQRAMQTHGSGSGPTSITVGDFGSRFGWYVDGINRKMATSWYKQEVDSRTPKGSRVYLVFTIRKDGSPTDVKVDRSSGSPTLDRSCQRGVQRVDSFGQLPSAYNASTLMVSYYCEY
jgi:protein TonB